MPQAPGVWFKPLILSVSQGFYVNLLKVRQSGVLSRHRHSGPVHAFTLRGSWHYLEHDWVAREGDYAFEPPGDGPWPAVIVYMDAMAVRPELKSMAERLAANGYVVALPNLFYRAGPIAPAPP